MTTKAKPYWWFQGDSVRELVNQLQDAGPSTARLEVHLDGKKMTFQVVAESEAARVRPLNDSHICPPDCPH